MRIEETCMCGATFELEDNTTPFSGPGMSDAEVRYLTNQWRDNHLHAEPMKAELLTDFTDYSEAIRSVETYIRSRVTSELYPHEIVALVDFTLGGNAHGGVVVSRRSEDDPWEVRNDN